MNDYFNPEFKLLDCQYIFNYPCWKHSNVITPYWRIYWNETPGGFIKRKNMHIELKPEMFVIIPGNTLFSSENTKPFNQLYIHFSVCLPFINISDKMMVFKVNDTEKFYFRNIISGIQDPSSLKVSSSLYIHSFIDYALAHLSEHDFAPSHKTDPRILKAIDIFTENITRIISNEEIAEKIGMSTNGFIRLFSLEIGESPQKYHRQKRVEHACLNLHFTEDDIEKIALETGFLDRYHFSREFKKIMKISPAEFRKKRM